MQIRNDYNAFSGTGYQHSHTHHLTKCLHEDEQKRQETAAAGMKQEAGARETQQKTEQDVLSEYHDVVSTKRKTGVMKHGFGIIKGVWDFLGDEKKKGTPGPLPPISEGPDGGSIDAASSAFKQGFPHQIAHKWEGIREKIKVGVKSALKRFGKDSDAFGALSDPRGRFTGKKDRGEQYAEKPGKGTRKEKPDIPTAALSETHLMDSYSKTGEYCRLNENLTYQKSKYSHSTLPQPPKDE